MARKRMYLESTMKKNKRLCRNLKSLRELLLINLNYQEVVYMEELKVCIYKKFNQALLTLFTSTGAENIPSNGPPLLEEFAVPI